MRISISRPGDLGEPEVTRWRELQVATPSLDNPFLSVEFALAMGRLRNYVRVAVIEDDHRIVGFLPFERHSFGIGKPLGTIGVIGPTRMNYSKVITLVDFTAQLVSGLIAKR